MVAYKPRELECGCNDFRLYGDGKLTLARAAHDAGVSMWEMMDYARARKVPAQYDLEDLERDLGTIHGSRGVSRAEQKGATRAE